jgi:hypothetical protein
VVGLLFAQLGLDCIKECSIEDGRLLAGQDLTFECDLAKVEAIAQQVRQTAAPTSRSNWANERRTLSVSRPIDVAVLNC